MMKPNAGSLVCIVCPLTSAAFLQLRDHDSLMFSFYPTNVSEIVNKTAKQTGFRDGTALLKLETHNLFPDVKNIALVDFDMIFIKDVCNEWYAETARMNEVCYPFAFNFNKEKRILLVGNNMTPWYQKTQKTIGVKVSPGFYPLYKGINTGTMFMDLDLMRSSDWTTIWIEELNSKRFTTKDYLLVRLLVFFLCF
jgi:hypothetical protein